MKPRTVLSLAIFSALGLSALVLASAMQRQAGSIEGVITNDLGPLSGAWVEARNSMSGETARTASDPGGRYRLENLRPGRYSLWAQAEGHSSVRIPQVVVEPGKSLRHDFRLSRSGRQTTQLR